MMMSECETKGHLPISYGEFDEGRCACEICGEDISEKKFSYNEMEAKLLLQRDSMVDAFIAAWDLEHEATHENEAMAGKLIKVMVNATIEEG